MNGLLRNAFWTAAVLSALVAPALLSPGPRADIVILRTGDKVVGLVRDMPSDPGKVLLVTANGEVVIPRQQIVEHTKEPASTGYRRIAEVYMERSQWETALKTLETAAQLDPPDPEVPRLLEQARERLVQDGLSQIEAENSLNRQRLNDVERLIADKDFEKAQSLLDSVNATSPTAEIQTRWTRLTVSLEIAWGLDREDKLDYSGAATHFKQALAYEPKNQTAVDHLLNIWADDPAHRTEVIQGYQRKLESDPSDILAARRLADLYLASGEVETALPYLQKVVDSGKFKDLGYGERLSTAYSTLAGKAAEQKDFDKAIELYSEYLGRVPGADPRPLYFYEYLKRYDALAPDDIEGRAELAEFLKSKGLDAFALAEVRSILEKDPQNQRALALLKDYAQQRLEEVQQDFQQGRYALAMAGARDLTQSYTNLPTIVEQASDLYARSEIEMKRMERERQNQARELVTLGDQYYQQAYFYANQMKSTETDSNVRVISHRQEAIKYARRGILAYQQALQINPNIGNLVGGDVSFKINDLTQLYNSLTQPPVPFARIPGRYGTSR